MAKRIVNRIGDIYSVNVGSGKQRFFQYITKDSAAFNSQVIRVFKSKYSLDFVFDSDQVIHDDVDFYAHTILVGNQEKYWTKVGSCKDVGPTDNIVFKADYGQRDNLSWYIWTINHDIKFVGRISPEEMKHIYWGAIYPFSHIVEKIKNGKYPGEFI